MSVFIGYPSFMAYQMMKGKKDNNDGFPSIPGTIARYSALGLTNEQMAANPVWVDKTGNGHDLQMKNFAWGGTSGVGGYVQNFNNFKNNATVDKVRIDEQSSNSIKVTILTKGISNAIYIPKKIYQFNKPYSIKISSEGYDEGDMALSFYASSISTATTVTVSLNPNGVTEIPAIKEDDFLAVYINVSGKVGSFTIEQLPLYPGALVFDGVDDWAGCDNLPLLPKEKGYSIIALRNWITRYDATQYRRPLISNLDTNDEAAFLIEYRKDENVSDVTGSYNSFTDVYIDDNNPITWQTSSSYNGQIIKKGTSKSSNKLCICKTYFGQLSKYANAAIWEIVILDHDATEEELTKIKDYFVKTYPWLFFDQAWTVVGKTNEDEDRATITNITGNGNNLVLSNFGFAEGSGYNEEGEYAGYLVTDGVDDVIQSKRFLLHRNWTMVGDWRFMPPEKNTNSGIVKSPAIRAIRLYNQLNNIAIYINRTTNPKSISGRSIKTVCSDGRIYLDDWSEFLDTELQTDFDNNAVISIANYGVNFTKMIFKNLSFYDNQLLSKDDCIKAYNYLQTLKAK